MGGQRVRDHRFGMHSVVNSIRRLWWVILASALVGAAGTYAFSATQTPMFASTASLILQINQGNSATDLNQGSSYTQSQMLSFAQLVPSSRVLQPVIDDLGIDATPSEVARSISVSIPQNTVTLRITADTSNAQHSADLANAVAEQLIRVVREVAPKDSSGRPIVTADVFDDAVAAQYQHSPNKTRDALIGGLLGLIVGVAIALCLPLLDTRVRNDDILAEITEAPVLGVIARSPLLATRGIGVARESLGHTAEEFRRVQTAVMFANVSARARVLLVTSGTPGEGKSTVSVNLAMTLASAGNSVILVDADLRRPRAHEHAGIDGSVGLTTVLMEDTGADMVKKRIAGTTLDVLPAGAVPPNPGELLSSEAMARVIQRCADIYDFVVIDSPPILSVADANLMAPLVDGVILVVDAAKTRRALVEESVKSLRSGGARILGTVLNRTRRDRRQSDYYTDEPRPAST